MLDGAQGDVAAEALDYSCSSARPSMQPRLADITYCHYPAEMGIYPGSVEDAVAYSARGGQVRVPTTTSTLCADLERPDTTGCPAALERAAGADRARTPRHGACWRPTPAPRSCWASSRRSAAIIASVESSAIIYFNSVLGARTNRGGLFTRYSAITGKYPLMGYLLDAQPPRHAPVPGAYRA